MPHVVITGASRGLGRAMVSEFGERGWIVSGCGRSPERMQELSASGAGFFQPVDVVQDEAVRDWAAAVEAEQGPVDLLLNNAALINANAHLWDVPVAEFDAVVDVNIKGVANVCRHFLPGMVDRRSGVVVNFSSGWGRSTSADVAPYCATKWAIEGLTQALAQELPSGMAAVPLNPGVINTDMLRSCFSGGAASYPPPEEWAEVAVPFLIGLSATDNGRPATVPI